MKNYELLWECFISEQMTAKQLDDHIREDPEFEAFVWKKIHELRDNIAKEVE
jgi:hypothetical protein